MPEGDQDQRAVAVAVATILRRLDQLLDFSRCQVLPGPQVALAGRAGIVLAVSIRFALTDRFS